MNWSFGPPRDKTKTTRGNRVPSRSQVVYLNDKPIGEVEIHMHARRGTDDLPDVSFGITCVAFGPPPGGK